MLMRSDRDNPISSLGDIKSQFWLSRVIVKMLQECGVENFVVGAGLRSAPLVWAIEKEVSEEKIKICNDERVAGFWALGAARAKKSSSAIITTSGSAVVELFPAIVEADALGQELFVITADRPRLMSGNGANQVINQNRIFGNYAEYFELNSREKVKQSEVEQVFHKFKEQEQKSICHINCHFDEPLWPDKENEQCLVETKEYHRQKGIGHWVYGGWDGLEQSQAVVVCGRDAVQNQQELELCKRFMSQYKCPMYLDILSGLRSTSMVEFSRSHLEIQDYLAGKTQDWVIIHLGQQVVSKKWEQWVAKQEWKHVLQVGHKLYDPYAIVTMRFKGSSGQWFSQESQQKYQGLKVFLGWDKQQKVLDKDQHQETAKNIVQSIEKEIPSGSYLYVGNGTIIRAFDRWYGLQETEKEVGVYGFRGVNGIDGNLATVLGFATNVDNLDLTTAIIGDQAAWYDISSIWDINYVAKRGRQVIIIVYNNGGGRVFEKVKLPIPESVMTRYFRNNNQADLSWLKGVEGLNYQSVSSDSFRKIYAEWVKTKVSGVIEIIVGKDQEECGQ